MLTVTKGYGYTVEDISHSCPSEMQPYIDAYELNKRIDDQRMWQMGLYVFRSLNVALDHALGGKNAHSEYPSEPLFSKYYEELHMTQEEKDRREIEKMIANEIAWQMNDQLRGLPQANDKLG